MFPELMETINSKIVPKSIILSKYTIKVVFQAFNNRIKMGVDGICQLYANVCKLMHPKNVGIKINLQ